MFCSVLGAQKMHTDRAHLLGTGLCNIALIFEGQTFGLLQTVFSVYSFFGSIHVFFHILKIQYSVCSKS